MVHPLPSTPAAGSGSNDPPPPQYQNSWTWEATDKMAHQQYAPSYGQRASHDRTPGPEHGHPSAGPSANSAGFGASQHPTQQWNNQGYNAPRNGPPNGNHYRGPERQRYAGNDWHRGKSRYDRQGPARNDRNFDERARSPVRNSNIDHYPSAPPARQGPWNGPRSNKTGRPIAFANKLSRTPDDPRVDTNCFNCGSLAHHTTECPRDEDFDYQGPWFVYNARQKEHLTAWRLYYHFGEPLPPNYGKLPPKPEPRGYEMMKLDTPPIKEPDVDMSKSEEDSKSEGEVSVQWISSTTAVDAKAPSTPPTNDVHAMDTSSGDPTAPIKDEATSQPMSGSQPSLPQSSSQGSAGLLVWPLSVYISGPPKPTQAIELHTSKPEPLAESRGVTSNDVKQEDTSDRMSIEPSNIPTKEGSKDPPPVKEDTAMSEWVVVDSSSETKPSPLESSSVENIPPETTSRMRDEPTKMEQIPINATAPLLAPMLELHNNVGASPSTLHLAMNHPPNPAPPLPSSSQNVSHQMTPTFESSHLTPAINIQVEPSQPISQYAASTSTPAVQPSAQPTPSAQRPPLHRSPYSGPEYSNFAPRPPPQTDWTIRHPMKPTTRGFQMNANETVDFFRYRVEVMNALSRPAKEDPRFEERWVTDNMSNLSTRLRDGYVIKLHGCDSWEEKGFNLSTLVDEGVLRSQSWAKQKKFEFISMNRCVDRLLERDVDNGVHESHDFAQFFKEAKDVKVRKNLLDCYYEAYNWPADLRPLQSRTLRSYNGEYPDKNLAMEVSELTEETWFIASHALSFTGGHHDAGGRYTYIHVLLGEKWWYYFRPNKETMERIEKEPQQVALELISYNYETMRALGDFYYVPLKAGNGLLQPSWTKHYVWTSEDSFMAGKLFDLPSFSRMERCLREEHVCGETSTNANRYGWYSMLLNFAVTLPTVKPDRIMLPDEDLHALWRMLLNPRAYVAQDEFFREKMDLNLSLVVEEVQRIRSAARAEAEAKAAAKAAKAEAKAAKEGSPSKSAHSKPSKASKSKQADPRTLSTEKYREHFRGKPDLDPLHGVRVSLLLKAIPAVEEVFEGRGLEVPEVRMVPYRK